MHCSSLVYSPRETRELVSCIVVRYIWHIHQLGLPSWFTRWGSVIRVEAGCDSSRSRVWFESKQSVIRVEAECDSSRSITDPLRSGLACRHAWRYQGYRLTASIGLRARPEAGTHTDRKVDWYAPGQTGWQPKCLYGGNERTTIYLSYPIQLGYWFGLSVWRCERVWTLLGFSRW